MKILFEQKDKELFFSMLSVYKIYGEISEKIQKDIDIPYSTIDILIAKLSDIIIKEKFYQATFDIDSDVFYSMIRFMLGTGTFMFASNNEAWSFFIKEFVSHEFIEISKDELFKYLIKNGIEI